MYGRLFGMRQSKAYQWIHVLFGVLQAILCALGDTPARSVMELAQRVGGAKPETVAGVVAPTAFDVHASALTFLLLAMTVPNGAPSIPRIRLNRRAVISARKSAARSKRAADRHRAVHPLVILG
jgi:hypothetical protein